MGTPSIAYDGAEMKVYRRCLEPVSIGLSFELV